MVTQGFFNLLSFKDEVNVVSGMGGAIQVEFIEKNNGLVFTLRPETLAAIMRKAKKAKLMKNEGGK